MYSYFSFTKNELILYHYLCNLGNGEYELRPCEFKKLGMAEQSFRDGRKGLEEKGYLKKIATNFFSFNKEGLQDER